jgi:hypothetical protein
VIEADEKHAALPQKFTKGYFDIKNGIFAYNLSTFWHSARRLENSVIMY